MVKLIYKGKVTQDTKDIYTFDQVVSNGLVQVTHTTSGDVFYYTQQEYNKLFKKL